MKPQILHPPILFNTNTNISNKTGNKHNYLKSENNTQMVDINSTTV